MTEQQLHLRRSCGRTIATCPREKCECAAASDWYADELSAAGITVDPIYGPDREAERRYREARREGDD